MFCKVDALLTATRLLLDWWNASSSRSGCKFGEREDGWVSHDERACSHEENGEVDVDSGAHLERGDVLDNGDRAEDIDDSLVDAHLISVPGVGTLTARRLSSGDSEDLGGDSHGAASLITGILFLGSGDDLGAGSLERSDFSALEGESKQDKQIISQKFKYERFYE